MTRILVTGSAGHLGEALMRVLRDSGEDATGLDLRASAFTDHVGSITDRAFVREALHGISVVLHTATLHKPHLATHSRQDFIDTNVSGTLSLLEEAVAAGVEAFVYTSSTSVFGRALTAASGAPATWITEDVTPVPKNIYGITKLAAEHLCELFYHRFALPCIVLRTSRFFPEADDDPAQRQAYPDDNLKMNEFLYRRVDLEDVVAAQLLAVEQASAIGFDRYVISATTPFERGDASELCGGADRVVARHVAAYAGEYARRGWSMPNSIDRVYVNERARARLNWEPKYDFGYLIERLRAGEDFRSPLARAVGSKGYHAERFGEGPYPLESA
jgi:UDP-glucose 4-epimerase